MTVVSVVIPFYNRPDWLKLAVESVLAQDLGDFEVIIVDDGSEEQPQFLANFAPDPRIRYVRQEHRGVSAARNYGMELATGTYIAFLDADDVFLPDKLRLQHGRMEARPDIALSHTSYWRMDAAGNDLEEIPSGAFTGRVYPGIVTRCPIATPTVMVRAEVVERHGFAFDETVGIGEDTILWVDFARQHEILGIDLALTRVRLHGRNAYSDPLAQYTAGRDVLQRATDKDPDLGFIFRRRALAGVCASAASLYLRRGQRGRAFGYFARGLVYWPLHVGILSSALRPLIPRRIRTALRPLREAVMGRGAEVAARSDLER